jgi:NAD(P)-dependent dehydrogenase (short-subunit alcohol dehydrogenase family)
VQLDISSEAEFKALIQTTVEQYGRIDYAFNNAGIEAPRKLLHEQSVEDFDKIMEINVRGMFLCMKCKPPSPYAGMNITHVTELIPDKICSLKMLGAIAG